MGLPLRDIQLPQYISKAFGLLPGEAILDSFCGGGGASTGIEQALGCSVDIGINHDADAIAIHKLNHPNTHHYNENIWVVDPQQALKESGYQSIGLAWWSPDCRHFSKAKGGKPVEKKIRGLSWVIVKWALQVQIRINLMENVEEIVGWGPLIQDENGNWLPDPDRKGETFEDFKKALSVGLTPKDPSWSECIRECRIEFDIKLKLKLFKGLGYDLDHRELVASDYGAPTIRKRLFLVMRNDGEPIAWPEVTHGNPDLDESVEPKKIAADIIDWSIPCRSIFHRKKPLAEKTMLRIAKGLKKFIFESDNPYIVPEHNVLPFVTEFVNASSQRNMSINEPFGTLTAGGAEKPALISFMAKHFSSGKGADIQNPLATVTSVNHNALVSEELEGTVIPTFEEWYEKTKDLGGSREDYDKLFAKGQAETLTTSHIIKMRGTNVGHATDEPAHTISAGGNHLGVVNSFLLKYFGDNYGTDIQDPVQTLTTKARFALVEVQGEIMVKKGASIYRVLDIGMRMLEPHELFLAQGFPPDYKFQYDKNGKKISKAKQVARCGNSVCPPVAKALVAANIKNIPSGFHLPKTA